MNRILSNYCEIHFEHGMGQTRLIVETAFEFFAMCLKDILRSY